MSQTELQDIHELLLERLAVAGVDDIRETEKGGRGSCPHCSKPDRFTVTERSDGDGYYVKCYAHCEQRDILDVLELSWRDLRLSAAGRERVVDLSNPELANARPISWAWQDRIPIARLSLVVGNEGTGKGTMIADLAARWTRGSLPGNLAGAPANVLVVGSEDLLKDAWTPRLHLARADLAHVFFQRSGDFEIDFTDPGDVEHLRGWIRRYSIKVVVFDALLDHLGGTGVDEFKARAVRGSLAPIRRLAGEEDIAVLGSMHPRKGRVSSFRELVANSHQFNAVSRSSLLLAQHPDDEQRRVLAFGKGNHAGMVPTLEFRVEVVHFELNGYAFRDVRAVDWDVSDVDLDEAIRASTGARSGPTKVEEAEDAIIEALKEGSRPSSEVKPGVAKKAGCGSATVERAAANLREDGVLDSAGVNQDTTWRLITRPITGERTHDEAAARKPARKPEKPVTTGVSADLTPVPAAASSSALSPVMGHGDGAAGNGATELDDAPGLLDDLAWLEQERERRRS